MPVSRQRKVYRAKKRPRVAPASAASAPARRGGKTFNYKVLVIIAIVAVAAAVIVYVVANRGSQAGNELTTASGMKYVDLKVGNGATPRMGQGVQVHYIGWLANGTEFNNSYKEGQPAAFSLGPGLIPGWNEALQSMKVGGKRRIILPPALAYGATGRPPAIPPNETLTFEIELLGVR
ncbi:MAG TPA: FKBP-type peptidyl-prolyl cis-trans isomerase [Pyrinomonadaceae bacterium]|nr:FKBP-type peptidyl-prolyl cis-trans isomerase [Pyrinomonadaceae bacterium]